MKPDSGILRTPKMRVYAPLAQQFAARVVMFHEAVAQRLSLNATDVKALRLVGEASLTASQIADRIGLTGAAVTALIDRLEACGYVRRERDVVDRRRVTVHAIPAKIREIDRLYEGTSVEMSGLLAKYNAIEFAAIVDYLTNTTTILTEETRKLRNRS